MRRLLCLACLSLALPAARADDPIPAKTLGELKGATVFIKVPMGRVMVTGSGFLVHADGETGYVVTNHHVVAPRGLLAASPTLVFWSGTKREKSVVAEVIGADPLRDLALLKVKGFKGLPRPIDRSQKVELTETMTVYALGFPFGRALSTTGGNPGLTIGKGTISSLRTDARDEVVLVQIDGDLNPGNSGGPVVDGKGRLVGVAVAKVRGTRIGLAVPARELGRMFAGRVDAPRLTAGKVAAGAAEVRAEVPVIDPLHKVRVVALHYVRQDTLKEKPKPGKGGAWGALPGATRTALKVEGGKGVATLTLRCPEKKKVTFLVQASYVDAAGKTAFTAPTPSEIDFDDAAVTRPGGPRDPVVITPAELDKDKVEVKLPCAVEGVAVGGGGRYLVLHLAAKRRLAVFDCSAAKVVKELPLAADRVKFAAGRDRLLVLLPEQGLVQCWSLKTFARLALKPLPVKGDVKALALGSDSDGPALVCLERGENYFLDPLTLKTVAVRWDKGKAPSVSPEFLRAAPDGRVFTWRNGTGGEPHTVSVLALDGGTARETMASLPGSLLLPSADGRFIYTETAVYDGKLKLLSPAKAREQFLNPHLPARQGDWFLRLEGGTKPGLAKLALHLQGFDKPFAALPDVEGYVSGPMGYGRLPDKLLNDQRIHLLPAAKLLLTIPLSNDRLVLRRLDTDKALDRSGVDYLFVASKPPLEARKGKNYLYRLEVKSKKGGLKFRVESGPDGMKVSPAGVVEWSVPEKATGEQQIILGVTDAAGQECLQSFTLTVVQ